MKSDYHFVYKTTCLITDKYYIGIHSTNDLDDGYLGSGTKLKSSIKKYGKNNHERTILEFVEDRNNLEIREAELVTDTIIADPLCMNLVLGGCSGTHGYIAITNGNIYKLIRKRDNVPTGWWKGSQNKSTKGKISITNGLKNVLIFKNDPIPDGWYRGSANRRTKG